MDSFIEIVGIVGDAKHWRLDADAPAQTYRPFLQRPFPTMTVVIRTKGNPQALVAAVRQEVLSTDKDQPVSRVATLEELLADSVAQERASMQLLMIFGGVALLLAAVGIYGVVAYSVAQRTREFGIRMAFGASAGTVLRLVVGQAVAFALVGAALGIAASFVVTRAIASLLFGVTATDAATFTIVPLALVAVSSLAGCVPALRATRVDPLVALREE